MADETVEAEAKSPEEPEEDVEDPCPQREEHQPSRIATLHDDGVQQPRRLQQWLESIALGTRWTAAIRPLHLSAQILTACR